MLFNSLEYFVFLPIMFLLYWFVLGKGLRLQNVLVLVGSYFFYGLWDWRFLFLIIASTVVDYFVGIMIHRNEGDRPKQKLWLWASIIFNISLLGFFKYYNFFVDSFMFIRGSTLGGCAPFDCFGVVSLVFFIRGSIR